MKAGIDNEGFIHNGRIVYAIQYKLKPAPGMYSSYVIAWLDRAGNSISPAQPAEKVKLMVTVKPGDWIVIGDERLEVVGVEVYRSLPLTVS